MAPRPQALAHWMQPREGLTAGAPGDAKMPFGEGGALIRSAPTLSVHLSGIPSVPSSSGGAAGESNTHTPPRFSLPQTLDINWTGMTNLLDIPGLR